MSVIKGLDNFYPGKVDQDAARNLFDLTVHVRKRLEERLPALNLKLRDLNLVALPDKVLAPGAESAFTLNGAVVRPICKTAKAFSMRIDLDPKGEFDRDELEPLVNEIVAQLKVSFYPRVH